MTMEQLKKWENGESSPTIKQAHILAHIYQQPFAAFYLPKPPANKFPLVHDYRTLPNASKGYISPELTFEVHKAAERREIALELYEEKGDEPPVFNLKANLSDDPEKLGSFMRDELGINSSNHLSWGNFDTAFRYWREAIEGLGILVFQIEDVSIGDLNLHKERASDTKVYAGRYDPLYGHCERSDLVRGQVADKIRGDNYVKRLCRTILFGSNSRLFDEF